MAIPLFSTARHSSSSFCTGYDMLFDFELLNKEPIKGIVGIDLRTAPRAKGARALWDAGRARDVVFVMV